MLTLAAVDYYVEGVLRALREDRNGAPAKRKALIAEQQRLRDQLAKYRSLIVDGSMQWNSDVKGGDQALRRTIGADRTRVGRAAPARNGSGADMKRLRKLAHEKLGAFREVLHGDVSEARAALEALLAGPIRCTPHVTADGRKTFAFRGETAPGILLVSGTHALHGCGTEERT